MESKYKELKLLKQSEKSTVYLVCSGERKYIRKLLTGRHPIYELLMNNPHPGLPRLLEVTVSENSTTILEKYIEGHFQRLSESYAPYSHSSTERVSFIVTSNPLILFLQKRDTCTSLILILQSKIAL